MKFLSCGWQYIVYDIGGGRVRKVKHSACTRYLFILSQLIFQNFWNPFSLHKIVISESKRVEEEMVKSNQYIQNTSTKIPLKYFGNPVFINSTDYEQDRVIPLKQLLRSNNVNELLNKYMYLIHTLWGYNIGETVFRFSANNGLDKYGEVIQMDFGEITTDKDRVLSDIKEKRWVRFSKYLDKETRKFYLKRMDEEMTEENLNRYWGVNSR
jgi:hypothetical protein